MHCLRSLLLLLPLLLAAGCDTYPITFGPRDAPAPRLYVTNQDEASVAVIDVRRNVLLRTVDLRRYGFSANARPHHVAVEPDGAYWYVSLIGENKVAKFDRLDSLVGVVEMETPGLLAIHPTRDLLVVGRSMTAVRPPASVGLIRRSDMTVAEVPVLYPRPHALAIAGDGNHAYTASLTQNQIMTVDLSTQEVTFTALEGEHQMFVQFAAAPGGKTLYVTGQMSGRVNVFSLEDPAAPRRTASIDVPGMPWHPVFTPDGRFLYVPSKGANHVSVIDVARGAVVRVIEGDGFAEPHGAAVSPEGRYVYISNNNLQGTYVSPRTGRPTGTVVVIDTRTRAVVRVIEVGANPTGMAVG